MRRYRALVAWSLLPGLLSTGALTWSSARSPRLGRADLVEARLTSDRAPCWFAREYRNGALRLTDRLAVASLEEFFGGVSGAFVRDGRLPAPLAERLTKKRGWWWPGRFGRAPPAGAGERRLEVAIGFGWPRAALWRRGIVDVSEVLEPGAPDEPGASPWPHVGSAYDMVHSVHPPYGPTLGVSWSRPRVLLFGALADVAVWSLIWAAAGATLVLLVRGAGRLIGRCGLEPRPTPRWLAALAVLGVISTVAVAFACALWVDVSRSDDARATSTAGWSVQDERRPGARRVTSVWGASGWSGGATSRNPDALVPSWAGDLRPGDEARDLAHVRFADARGWPWPALWSWYGTGGQASAHGLRAEAVRHGVRLSDRPGPRNLEGSHVRCLPLRVLAGGFALDSAVYVAVWTLVLLSVSSLWWVAARLTPPFRVATPLLVVVLGAVTTVALSWSLAAWGPRPQRGQAQEVVLVSTGPYLGATERRAFVSSGWPRRALEGRIEIDHTGSLRFDHALELEQAPLGGPDQARCLPLKPVWGGLVLDTAFYGAAWLLVLGLAASPWSLRRLLRRRSGACEECAYDLRGTSGERCPECGWRSGR